MSCAEPRIQSPGNVSRPDRATAPAPTLDSEDIKDVSYCLTILSKSSWTGRNHGSAERSQARTTHQQNRSAKQREKEIML